MLCILLHQIGYYYTTHKFELMLCTYGQDVKMSFMKCCCQAMLYLYKYTKVKILCYHDDCMINTMNGMLGGNCLTQFYYSNCFFL